MPSDGSALNLEKKTSQSSSGHNLIHLGSLSRTLMSLFAAILLLTGLSVAFARSRENNHYRDPDELNVTCELHVLDMDKDVSHLPT